MLGGSSWSGGGGGGGGAFVTRGLPPSPLTLKHVVTRDVVYETCCAPAVDTMPGIAQRRSKGLKARRAQGERGRVTLGTGRMAKREVTAH